MISTLHNQLVLDEMLLHVEPSEMHLVKQISRHHQAVTMQGIRASEQKNKSGLIWAKPGTANTGRP